jgi:hypothetical protein
MLLSNMIRPWIDPIKPVLPPIRPPRPIIRPEFTEHLQRMQNKEMLTTIAIGTAITLVIAVAIGTTIYFIKKKKGNNNVRN